MNTQVTANKIQGARALLNDPANQNYKRIVVSTDYSIVYIRDNETKSLDTEIDYWKTKTTVIEDPYEEFVEIYIPYGFLTPESANSTFIDNDVRMIFRL